MKRIAILAGLLAAGCSLSSEPGPPPLLPTLPRSLTPAETALVEGSNEFGFALFGRVRGATPASNLFLSPTSAAMALGMTLNGAAGLTLDSMAVALRLGGTSLPDINAGSRSLIDLLRGLDPTSEFLIANSIWAQSGVPWRQAFLDAGRSSYDAEIRSLDLQAPASVNTINDWVKQKTNGRIPTILERIESHEVMFLINAIYFKGQWRSAFDPARTRPGTFHSLTGDQSVSLMHREPDTLRYARSAEAEVVELLYGNGAWAMVIVLPLEGRDLAELTQGLDTARWHSWTEGLQDVKIGLVMPKFRLEYKRELAGDLAALGMRRAFDPDRADFSNMADLSAMSGNLFLTKVTQKTFVDVNEEGTEAAAVTSVGVGVTSAPLTVVVDRPFLFAIRERHSGTVLFLGQITRIP